ncbi:PREDICTED: cationic peroxidase 1-like [Lupinus angustifolius]|uniref:cationic peroxidase 1-like n=1 Tax=Lupinus angustifolius TaxID=3871 RepID=UPI00092F5667|nr:PREDICTED: cationic peroxidase 1-like [Lupinus angustifolius]
MMTFHLHYYIFCFSFLFYMFSIIASSQLSSNFYATTCPNALSTIKSAVVSAVAKEYRMGASLLRLHFHDCFVNGCDASVLLDDTSSFTGEKTAAANVNSLRGFDVIDDIKTKLETACPGIVSCADILAVAARDSVVALGGQSWSVGLGRRDSTTASKDAATTDIPSPLMDLSDLISAFSTKGFTTQEMVALTGAHTIGQARCQLFRGRIYNETNIDSDFATSVKSKCPSSGGDSNLTSLDVTTNELFDNAYFKNLVNKKGLLHSDQQLFSGGSTDSQVTTYSTSPSTFYADFSTVMVKMGNLSILTGQSGQIRTNCRNVN